MKTVLEDSLQTTMQCRTNVYDPDDEIFNLFRNSFIQIVLIFVLWTAVPAGHPQIHKMLSYVMYLLGGSMMCVPKCPTLFVRN